MKRVAIIAFVSGLLFASGIALAEWLANGTGSGYAKAGNAENLTTSVSIASGTLYPGGTGDMALTIHNPNQFPVTVTSVVGAGTIVSSSAACNANGHGVTFTNQIGLALVVPANGTASFVLAGSVSMAESSANECQGATFEIPVALAGVSGTTGSGGGGPIDGDLDGYTSAVDCDDSSPTIHPGATEMPNALDDDCDGLVDEGFGAATYYPDGDGDTYGDSLSAGLLFPVQPAGFVLNNLDCNDALGSVYPGASETSNGLDDDCDGVIDDGLNLITGWPDLDDDGWGDFFSAGQLFASIPVGFASNNNDCDDTDYRISPGATEVFNGVDDDCDGQIDDNAVGGIRGYVDADADGYGVGTGQMFGSLPSGYAALSGDCNDANADRNPGAPEVPDASHVDENCDGLGE